MDQDQVKIKPNEVLKALSEGEPRIETSAGKDGLLIAVVTLQSAHVPMVARRIKEVLQAAV